MSVNNSQIVKIFKRLYHVQKMPIFDVNVFYLLFLFIEIPINKIDFFEDWFWLKILGFSEHLKVLRISYF